MSVKKKFKIILRMMEWPVPLDDKGDVLGPLVSFDVRDTEGTLLEGDFEVEIIGIFDSMEAACICINKHFNFYYLKIEQDHTP